MEKLKRIIVKVLKAIFIRKKIAASKTIEQPVRHKHDQISRDRTASTGRPILSCLMVYGCGACFVTINNK
ncbi:hypothetical protein LWM68_33915 [Niabella sp. W65]|nr:hypothetical protein [Niabella sp. W65]MCH7367322.1 hypothetical protein [Niabella sp. W65]